MLKEKLKIKDSVDIYINKIDDGNYKIQFFKINTRERLNIIANEDVVNSLSLFDGDKTVGDVFSKIGVCSKEEINELISFLMMKDILTTVKKDSIDIARYQRQVAYLDDLIHESDGELSQRKIIESKIVVFGAGSVSGFIMTSLVRAGVEDIVIVDDGKVDRSDLYRTIYANNNNVGMYKADALSEYLKSINSKLRVKVFRERIYPKTNLDRYISEDCSMVINTADEPYIGHTTLKIGRYLWEKEIAMYVAGGFDAHLMSSGEIIVKGLTPCPDCCANTFKVALSDWKPKYIKSDVVENKEFSKRNDNLRSSGGFSQGLFGSGISSMNIIDYLVCGSLLTDKLNKRGEYLINSGNQTWFEMKFQKECEICNER